MKLGGRSWLTSHSLKIRAGVAIFPVRTRLKMKLSGRSWLVSHSLKVRAGVAIFSQSKAQTKI